MNTIANVTAGLALAIGLSACVHAPTAPSASVMPGPNKSAEEFQADQATCMGLAQQQTAGAQQGFNAGQLTNLLNGGTPDATATGAAQASLQQQYDGAYGQCMYARGNLVPGLSQAAYDAGPSSGLVRAIQRQLIRLGYLTSGADGVYGPATRSAILAYQQADGLAADGAPTSNLLASLRSTPGAARARWRNPAPSGTAEQAQSGKGSGWVAPASGAPTTITPAAAPGGSNTWVAPGSTPAPASN